MKVLKPFVICRRITPKRLTSLQCPSPGHNVKATQLLRCWSDVEPFVTLCMTWSAWCLNLVHPYMRHAC